MQFIHDDFLLSSKAGRRLYHEFAVHEPILDYHGHLSPADIAVNRRFRNLTEIWLEGDHYKWRAMRANGVPEEFCTGAADPYEKFMAWARTVPNTLRNPLYHWTHLELNRYFGVDELLDERSAPGIWERANEQLATDRMTVHGILSEFKVDALCTTDDPIQSMEHHRTIARSELATGVYPAFRPDKAFSVDQPGVFNPWVDGLESAAGVSIGKLDDLLSALKARHDFFGTLGCRLSDHGLPCCYSVPCSEIDARSIFEAARSGRAADAEGQRRFAAYLMLFLGRLDAEKGWTKQLHLGSIRNNRTRLFRERGPDVGCDSIGDWPQAEALCAYLDLLDREGALPKMILYNVNPADNFAIATAAGNFQDGTIPGKIQFGSGWWYLDQKEGMEWQLNALSNTGLLAHFVGMLTDSRSFMSFPRHEYFRRVLCDLLGRDMERGELPDDDEMIGNLVRRVCYSNAKSYLGF